MRRHTCTMTRQNDGVWTMQVDNKATRRTTTFVHTWHDVAFVALTRTRPATTSRTEAGCCSTRGRSPEPCEGESQECWGNRGARCGTLVVQRRAQRSVGVRWRRVSMCVCVWGGGGGVLGMTSSWLPTLERFHLSTDAWVKTNSCQTNPLTHPFCSIPTPPF
jgi:hypothetical protein